MRYPGYMGGEPKARALTWFGMGLAIAALAAFVAQTPPALWLSPACDALSSPWLLLTTGGGVAAFGLGAATSVLPTWRQRTAAAALAGAALVLAVGVFFPSCLAGPYQMVPEPYRGVWLHSIGEARSFIRFLHADPGMVLQIVMPMMIGAIAATFGAWRGKGDDALRPHAAGEPAVARRVSGAVSDAGRLYRLCLPAAGGRLATGRNRFDRSRRSFATPSRRFRRLRDPDARVPVGGRRLDVQGLRVRRGEGGCDRSCLRRPGGRFGAGRPCAGHCPRPGRAPPEHPASYTSLDCGGGIPPRARRDHCRATGIFGRRAGYAARRGRVRRRLSRDVPADAAGWRAARVLCRQACWRSLGVMAAVNRTRCGTSYGVARRRGSRRQWYANWPERGLS